MTSRPKFGLGVARGNDGPSAPHAAQRGGGGQAQFPSLGRQKVANLMRFEMATNILGRVEFRRISRQSFDDDAFAGARDVILHQQAAVDRGAIPEDEELAGQVPLEMTEKLDDLRTLDAALVNLKVKPPEGQAADDRKAPPIEGLMQHRRLAAQRPGADMRWPRAQTAFIDEDDGSLLLTGFFFKAGHSTRRQRRMARSSRSMARRSGRWQLKPLAPRSRQTCPGW